MDCFYELSQMTQGVTEGKGNSLGAVSAGVDHQGSVRVIEQKTVGAYEVAVLAATDAGSLQRWLEQNQFSYPKDNAAVIEEYVRKGWYFVALRIQIEAGDSFKLSAPGTTKAAPVKRSAASVHAKLAQGELHPLQISFDTPRCIFPLKISAVNGHPSEISIYVLSHEPLLEKSIFTQEVDEARQEAAKHAGDSTGSWERMQTLSLEMRYRGSGAPLSAAEKDAMRTLLQTEHPWPDRPRRSFYVTPGPQFLSRLTPAQLPRCARQLPRLKTNEWCLTKQMRTFAPAEMHDLEFEPAAAVLGAYLADEQAGPAVLYLLRQCGSSGQARLRQALASKNGVERTTAAWAATEDEELRKRLAGMIHDPEPKVRARAIEAGTDGRGPRVKIDPKRLEEMIQFLKDPDMEVRGAAAGAIGREAVIENAPRFLKLLRDPDTRVQAVAFGLLTHNFQHIQIPREDLKRLFATTNFEVACSFRWTPLAALAEATSDDAAILLTNRFVSPRLAAIALLEQQPDKRAIEIAITALKDRNILVQKRAWRFLMTQTDQTFASDETRKWAEWWAAHQATFTPKSAEQVREQTRDRMQRYFEGRRSRGPN
jgi:HEAT repeat protein